MVITTMRAFFPPARSMKWSQISSVTVPPPMMTRLPFSGPCRVSERSTAVGFCADSVRLHAIPASISISLFIFFIIFCIIN